MLLYNVSLIMNQRPGWPLHMSYNVISEGISHFNDTERIYPEK